MNKARNYVDSYKSKEFDSRKKVNESLEAKKFENRITLFASSECFTSTVFE